VFGSSALSSVCCSSGQPLHSLVLSSPGENQFSLGNTATVRIRN
jgi:hypothetical protein